MIAPSMTSASDVEHALRDDRAEQDRERLAHPAGPPGEHRRAGRLAEAGRQRRRHQHSDHRRRGHVAAAQRAVRQRRAGDRVPGARAEEERGDHQGGGDQRPRSRRSGRSCWTTWSTPIRRGRDEGQRRAPSTRGDAEPDPPGGPVAWRPPPAGSGSSEGSSAGRPAASRRSGRAPSAAAPRSSGPAGAGACSQPLVDASIRRRPEATRNARRSAGPRRPSRADPLGLEAERLQLLGEALGVGGRDEDPVDAVGDDVVVAGDVRGDDRGSGRERLGQDHAEALAR